MKLNLSDTSDAAIDLGVLLKTRLLIQANSGGGKSWLLRRLAEQAFGKVQVIIIDPEGEFSTLREKFDYVLVGKGGETPADCRSAAMVAHKLLELHASAVCDLYEMKPQDRHHWVKLFIDALIDAPKNLWHPVIVIVDEAHVFCPESKAGESEASGSMIDLATRGRKRGYCAVFATQRLGKLKKDAAAELTNVMIGQTFIDIDRDRAADCLGVSGPERRAFDNEIKTVQQGNFYALGRAICTTRTKVQVGKVQTTHPEIGGKKFSAEPPPPSEKVKLMMPKLADLPKAAEEKAKTESELRTEVRVLRQQLADAKRTNPVEKSITEIKNVPALTDAERKRLTKAIETGDNIICKYEVIQNLIGNQDSDMIDLRSDLRFFKDLLTGKLTPPKQFRPAPLTRQTFPIVTMHREKIASVQTNGDISPVGQRILNALAEMEMLGTKTPDRELVALLAGYTHLLSKGFVNAVGELRTAGLVSYPNSDSIQFTDAGREKAQFPSRPSTSEEIQNRVCNLIGGKASQILRPLIDNYPNPCARTDIAAAAGYTHLLSKGFVNAISRLRTLGFVEYPDSQSIVATKILFLND